MSSNRPDLDLSEPRREAAQPTTTPGQMFSGDEANQRVRVLAERRMQKFTAGDSITTGIRAVDDANPPLTRGDLACIVGTTSEGKSMLATAIARHTINQIKIGTRTEKSAVIVVLTEETIEARRVQLWGDPRVSIRDVLVGAVPLQSIDANIYKSTGEPLYFIGESATGETRDDDDTFGALTVKRVHASLNVLARSGVRPELVIIDHVHDLAYERDLASEQELYELIGRQVVKLSTWLREYCPLLAVCQAKKEVMQRSPKDRMPTKFDLSYMASVARRARDMYSIWYPAAHMQPHERLKLPAGEVAATKGTFIVAATKARYGDVNRPFAMTAIDDEGHWTHMLREMKPGNSAGQPSDHWSNGK